MGPLLKESKIGKIFRRTEERTIPGRALENQQPFRAVINITTLRTKNDLSLS